MAAGLRPISKLTFYIDFSFPSLSLPVHENVPALFLFARIFSQQKRQYNFRHTAIHRRWWESNPRAHEGPIAFRVFYSQHTLADFEKKCPILREKALVRKKIIFSPLRLFPTVRNARELSERTNRTAIKHNNRKSPLNQWFSELRQLKRSFDFECVMRYGKC